MAENNRQPDYDTLLRLYGEAMLRTGQLEGQVANLTDQLRILEDVPAPGGLGEPTPASEELRGLSDKIDSLRRKMTDPSETSPKPSDSPGDEISQHRLQITSMANQLAVAKDELATLRGSRKRRSGKKQPSTRWKALRRRLGIDKSCRP